MIHGLIKRIVSVVAHTLIMSVSMASFFILPPSVQAENVEIQKIWSSEDQFTWVDGEPKSLTDLSITVNGNPLDSENMTITNYDGTLHIRVPLEYDASSLIVIKDGNNVLFRADVYYAPAYESELVPEEYIFNPFHIEENEKHCLSCHRLEITNSDLISSNNTEHICYPCHKRKFSDRTFQHYAAGLKWECLRCHQTTPMESDYSIDIPVKFSIKEGMAVASLCYQCHINREKEFAKYKYLHGPVSMQLCILCHNPHGSNTNKLLHKGITSLCVDCHRLQDMLSQHSVHSPITTDGCISCHDPHGSNFPFFLNKEINGVCVQCHTSIKKLKNNHPIKGHPVAGYSDPTDSDRPFTCISCHDPHASEFTFLLADEDIMQSCARCHSYEN